MSDTSVTIEQALKELSESWPNHYRRIDITCTEGPSEEPQEQSAMIMVYDNPERPLNGIVLASAATLELAMKEVRDLARYHNSVGRQYSANLASGDGK
jgi:hypothetical protein